MMFDTQWENPPKWSSLNFCSEIQILILFQIQWCQKGDVLGYFPTLCRPQKP